MDYSSYLERRSWGHTALEAHRETLKAQVELKPRPVVAGLISAAIGAMVFVTVQGIVDRITGDNIRQGMLWITSPSGQTTVALPLYTALRIIRKREWDFAEVEPITQEVSNED